MPEIDPKKQEAQALRAKTLHEYEAKREGDIERLRELRHALAHRMKGTLPPFDEFTVFGLPSRAGQVENLGVHDCMRRDDGPRDTRIDHLVQPPKHLVRDIETLEQELRPSKFGPPNRYERVRPTTATLRPRISPRSTFGSARGPTRYSESGPSGRPLTSVPAYRRAGLDNHAYNTLRPSTRQSIEEWRTFPKYEEQMMLGHLKANSDKLGNGPLWKLKRYEKVPPRLN